MTQPNHVPDAWDSVSQRNGSVMAHKVRRKYTASLLPWPYPALQQQASSQPGTAPRAGFKRDLHRAQRS